MNAQYLKNLIMTVVAACAVILTESTINVPILLMTAIGTALLYIAQHKWIPSTSKPFELKLQDFIVAICLGIGSAFINSGSTYIVDGVFCLLCVWKLALGVAVGYLAKTIPANGVAMPIVSK